MKSQGYKEKSNDINRIVMKHEGLVRRIAYKMHSRVASFIERDDLLQSELPTRQGLPEEPLVVVLCKDLTMEEN